MSNMSILGSMVWWSLIRWADIKRENCRTDGHKHVLWTWCSFTSMFWCCFMSVMFSFFRLIIRRGDTVRVCLSGDDNSSLNFHIQGWCDVWRMRGGGGGGDTILGLAVYMNVMEGRPVMIMGNHWGVESSSHQLPCHIFHWWSSSSAWGSPAYSRSKQLLPDPSEKDHEESTSG